MHQILAIDTSSEVCSVALINHSKEIIEKMISIPKSHDQYILRMIDNLLKEANISIKHIDLIAFSQGPGNFISLRIGISVAQGIALGINVPLIGVSTLEMLAQGVYRRTGRTRVLTAIDAHMKELYWSVYSLINDVWVSPLDETETILTPKSVLSLIQKGEMRSIINDNDVGNWAYAGSGWKMYPILEYAINKFSLIDGKTVFPSARDILPIALKKLEKGFIPLSVEEVQPIYLRHNIAKINE
ncbi:tRNA (adenosine(37)-N6)-threonylcarbamoyltransferase complex dimerization subunit type 1 TsaB [Candidatus Schneideria nysicola]|uniref:tRNA (adenosine(37)-N6)-threonylcarbamoyltransferase complex dimerization subunit type 1 TsaB n=1 Tax=Candidatus Schneideria nysicola TaxID=1081631 RepID=UPI001CAA53E4|nr:tRNA (adenosine(37)-N6)-threonylcarbamoyltransferase complex dimerization subunit type 1 TsaB [Candidatus Schneideria nysicola]UAJ65834.1 tRNA (adenosine(37)-N6)-threonylcarbamoyltransferase complex dimerization subunit type 1 TsaB [Candidatus Schneideria nysicola]